VTKAADDKSDLIVMGTHGRSGFDRLMLGSVTEKVLRKRHLIVVHVMEPLPPTPFAARARGLDVAYSSDLLII